MTPKLAIDTNSLKGVEIDGLIITPAKIFELYRDSGVILYNSMEGEKPVVFEGEIGLYDSQSEEGKKLLKSLI